MICVSKKIRTSHHYYSPSHSAHIVKNMSKPSLKLWKNKVHVLYLRTDGETKTICYFLMTKNYAIFYGYFTVKFIMKLAAEMEQLDIA